jgi:CheY-like chemotaxis protein
MKAAKAATPQDGFVLVVEDDAGIRSLLLALTRRLGFDCDGVGDGEAAIELLRGRDPTVILLDLLLPKLDGFGVMGHLRGTRPHLLQRIIVVTAAGQPYLRESAELNEVWCIRRKPLDIVELGEQMRRCAKVAFERAG